MQFMKIYKSSLCLIGGWHNILISKPSVHYLKKTQKFGIRLPKSVEEAYKIDTEN